jgi:hypothetical protein
VTRITQHEQTVNRDGVAHDKCESQCGHRCGRCILIPGGGVVSGGAPHRRARGRTVLRSGWVLVSTLMSLAWRSQMLNGSRAVAGWR